MDKVPYNPFLKSALTEYNPFISTKGVEEWLHRRNKAVEVNVQRINFSQLKDWIVEKDYQKIRHKTGRFFSIEGIEVNTNWGVIPSWSQPIINQPEIGYLGIIVKEFNGILYFLLQAKIEPGNINNVQLSPTLQATKSNYSQVHGGKAPLYLEYFKDRQRVSILLDQLQSEQGARFLQKRNRNIIIQVFDDIVVHEDFIWLTLGQIKRLIAKDNLVNMDTRTVISGISFALSSDLGLHNFVESSRATKLLVSSVSRNVSLYTIEDLIAWLTELKCRYELQINRTSLSLLDNWIISDDKIEHVSKKYFRVIAANITIGNREVRTWAQPLIQPAQEGLIAFVVKEIYGVLHFLVQAKLECGNFDILELAPTVQTLTGDYKKPDYEVPFLHLVLNSPKSKVWFDTMQSEEGGRFYKEQNRNIIVEVGDDFPIDVPENYRWMTLSQLNEFIRFNNYLNIQARSILSAVSFI